VITILVGEDTEEEQRFTVHKDMICAKSKFFKAACSERWASRKEKIVRPPKGTPEQFQLYVEWVYFSQLNIDIENTGELQAVLMDLYILGDAIDDYQLRNATIESLIANTVVDSPIDCPQLNKVYEATTAGSPFRKFVVDWVVTSARHGSIKSNIAHMPAELVQELALFRLENIALMTTKDAIRFMKVMFKPETDAD